MAADRDQHLRALGRFLRTRRDNATAEGAPTAPEGRRQVTGLRRAEVAERSFISTDYYTRIEQGRLAPSRDTLKLISAALRLNTDEQRYAERLLARHAAAPSPPQENDQATDPAVTALLRQLDRVPALVIGSGLSILDWNDAAVDLLIDFGSVPRRQRGYASLLFCDREFQRRFCDLASMQRVVVGILRSSADPADPAHDRTVRTLLDSSPTFQALWSDHDVALPHRHITFDLRTRSGQRRRVTQTVWQDVDNFAQRLVLYTTHS